MTNKRVIFESEEEFDKWWYECGIGIKDSSEYKSIFRRTKEHGYIKKNPVEEVEEMINSNLTHHREYIKIEEQKKILTAIQYLKEK